MVNQDNQNRCDQCGVLYGNHAIWCAQWVEKLTTKKPGQATCESYSYGAEDNTHCREKAHYH
jgi:hypothetical protein